MSDLYEKFRNILSSNNYKLTSQREDILKVLIENQNQHFRADTLLKKVKEKNPDIGLATIYRNLELFCELDITNELDFDSSYKYYELNLDENHHHHLVCVNCDKIIEFNDEVLEKFEKKVEEKYDFEIVNHQIKFYGICKDCSKKEK
ncbi:MAG TPA: Fur family transcriptional regulator [Halanaerobiales bacterium]|nr:Fur family transcriptional regulator [Halanaerobiales bacterium]